MVFSSLPRIWPWPATESDCALDFGGNLNMFGAGRCPRLLTYPCFAYALPPRMFCARGRSELRCPLSVGLLLCGPSLFFCASLHMVLAFSYSLAGNRDLLWTDVALKCGELALSSECDLSRVVFLTSFLCSQMWCQIVFSLTCVDQIVGSSVSFLTCTLLVTIARIRVSLGRRLWANSCSPLWGVPPSYLCSICVDSPVTEGSDFSQRCMSFCESM